MDILDAKQPLIQEVLVRRTQSKRGFSVQEATSLKRSLKAQDRTSNRQSAVSALPVTQQPAATAANSSMAALTQSLKSMPFSSLLAIYRYDRDWHQSSLSHNCSWPLHAPMDWAVRRHTLCLTFVVTRLAVLPGVPESSKCIGLVYS